MDKLLQTDLPDFLAGGGDMAQLIANYNWQQTPLGTFDEWPAVLKDTVSLIVRTHFPMFLWWGEDLIQFYNDAFRPSLGANGKHPSALGQRGEECWQEIWPTIKPMIDQVYTGGTSTWRENQLMPIYRNGQLEDVYWTFSYSLVGTDAKQRGVLVMGMETTSQVQAFDGIKTAKDDLQFAIQAAELGTWDLDPVTMRFLGNDRLRSWFGIKTAGENIDLEQALNAISEIDRTRVIDSIARAMEFASGGQYDIDYTITRSDGEPRFVRARGKCFFNEDRQPVRFSGTLEDITEEKLAADRMESLYEQLRLSKEAAGLGMFDFDLKNGQLIWDERCRELFGISHHNNITYETDFVNGLHPDDRDRITRKIDKLLRPGSDGDYDVEYRTVGAEDGQLRWVRAKGKVFFDQHGAPYRFIGSVLDITESKLDDIRKNDFIGMVSHELKTPLTSINALIQVLQMKLKNADNFVVDALDRASKQSKKMSTLINGFLNISRLESGKIAINKEDFMIDSLLRELIREVELTNSTHEIYFEPCPSIFIKADRDKIGSVISNLLSNAVKYSPKGKQVTVTCQRIGSEVLVSVRDEGMGIKPQDREKLFDRYYRVQTKHTQHISGFGIGLYLSAEIIQRHNGRIWLESESGQGSTFYFSIPA